MEGEEQQKINTGINVDDDAADEDDMNASTDSDEDADDDDAVQIDWWDLH